MAAQNDGNLRPISITNICLSDGPWRERARTVTMFLGYSDMLDFFTSFDWWRTEPQDELVDSGIYCLAEPGETYAVYFPKGGKTTVRLEPGTYEPAWVSALSGEKMVLAAAEGSSWMSPDAPDKNDWALLLRRKHKCFALFSAKMKVIEALN